MRSFLALVLLLGALNSCESESATNNNGNGNNQTLTGTLTGRVELYDNEGSYITDKQGVVVSIDGTNIKATTTAEGKWVIHNLPAGTYNLTFEKPGYGLEKNLAISLQAVGQHTLSL